MFEARQPVVDSDMTRAMDEVTDPTDWPPHLRGLAQLDSQLRCHICYDFFRSPKILPCGHSFCAACIRQHKGSGTKVGRRGCPSCREEYDDVALDAQNVNVALGEAATAFADARSLLMSLVNGSAAPLQANTNAERPLGCGDPPTAKRKRTESDSKNADYSVRAKPESPSHVSDVEEEQVPPGHELCPVCSEPVPQARLQAHVNRCLDQQEKGANPAARSRTSLVPTPSDVRQGPQPSGLSLRTAAHGRQPPPLKVPPKMVFNTMKLYAARKALEDLGINCRDLKNKSDMQKRFDAFRVFCATANDEGRLLGPREAVREFNWRQLERGAAAAGSSDTASLLFAPPAGATRSSSAAEETVPNAVGSFKELLAQLRSRPRPASQPPVQEEACNAPTPHSCSPCPASPPMLASGIAAAPPSEPLESGPGNCVERDWHSQATDPSRHSDGCGSFIQPSESGRRPAPKPQCMSAVVSTGIATAPATGHGVGHHTCGSGEAQPVVALEPCSSPGADLRHDGSGSWAAVERPRRLWSGAASAPHRPASVPPQQSRGNGVQEFPDCRGWDGLPAERGDGASEPFGGSFRPGTDLGLPPRAYPADGQDDSL